MITIKDFTVGEPCYVVEKKYGRVKNLEIKEAVVLGNENTKISMQII